MSVDEVNGAKLHHHFHADRGPGLAAEEWRDTWQTGHASGDERKAAKYGIAIMLFAQLHGRVKVVVPTQLRGDDCGLVHSRRTRVVEIKLLQSDHIDGQLGYNCRDSSFGALPVHADTAMDVVSGDTES